MTPRRVPSYRDGNVTFLLRPSSGAMTPPEPPKGWLIVTLLALAVGIVIGMGMGFAMAIMVRP